MIKKIIFCDNQHGSICKVLPGSYHFTTIDINAGYKFRGKYKGIPEIIIDKMIK